MKITTIIYSVLNGRADEFINDFLLFALCLIAVVVFGYAVYQIAKESGKKRKKIFSPIILSTCLMKAKTLRNVCYFLL